jgi:molybdopterin-guanine dinucleotide biosynthesis protein A
MIKNKDNKEQVTAIVLAGGNSSRMGTDKALLRIESETWLEAAVNKIKPFCTEIFISSDNDLHEIKGATRIEDEIKNCGPAGGICSCLNSSKTIWNLVLSVDSVFVDTEFIKFLISNIGPFDAIVPVYNNLKEPLIALYHINSLPVFEKYIQNKNYRMHDIINELNTQIIDCSYWLNKHPKLFENMNTFDDLKKRWKRI